MSWSETKQPARGVPLESAGGNSPLRDQAIAAHREGRLDTAISLFERVLATRPNDVIARHAAALAYRDRGEPDLAILNLERAVVLEPTDPVARHNLGSLYFAAQRFADAREAFQTVVAKRPNWGLALRNLAATLVALDLPNEALPVFSRALQISRDDPWLHYHVGRAGVKLGNSQLAISAFEEALKLNPRNFDFAVALAERCIESGYYERGEAAFKHALMLNPTHVPTILSIADRLILSGRAEESLILLDHARELAPEETSTLVALASARRALGDPDQAEAICRDVLSRDPSKHQARFLLGLLALEVHRLDAAQAYFNEVLTADPGHLDAATNDAYATLMRGDLEAGWIKFERRLGYPALRYFHHQGPRWTGQSLEGVTLLIEAEQGFGDTLQFIRYVPLVARQAERVLLRVPPPLRRVLGAIGDNVEFVSWEARDAAFDLRIELMSLPRYIGISLNTIPASVPYLTVEPDLLASWQARLEADGSDLRVGLVWAGNPDHQNDCNRSMPVGHLNSLTHLGGINFYSLQVGPRAGDLRRPDAPGIIDLSDSLGDYAETAAALMALDLLIAVDTSVVHLAGALGRPVWLLLSTASEWRWMLDRDDSPWYPTLRIFRQRAYRDWAELMIRVSAELGRTKSAGRPLAQADLS